jgi:hypothetical protein
MVSPPFAIVLKTAQDQSLFTRFVKGLADNAAIASDVLPFLTAASENGALTGSLLAKPRQLWPVSLHILIFHEEEK